MAPKIKRSLGDTRQFELVDGRLVSHDDYYAGLVPEIRAKSAEKDERPSWRRSAREGNTAE